MSSRCVDVGRSKNAAILSISPLMIYRYDIPGKDPKSDGLIAVKLAVDIASRSSRKS
jgi:hypothetical protein